MIPDPKLARAAGVAFGAAPDAMPGFTSQIAGVGVNPSGYTTADKKAAQIDAKIGPRVLPTIAAATRKDAFLKDRRHPHPGDKGAAQTQADHDALMHVAPPRPMESSGVTNTIGSVGSVGSAAMQAEFMLPMVGWAFRNTIGQVSQTARQATGAVTYAPFKALWNVSTKDLLTGNWKQMKGNYYRALYDYTTGAPYGKKYAGWESMKHKAAAFGVEEIKTLEKATGSTWNRILNGRAYGVLLKFGLGAATAYLGIRAISGVNHSIGMMQELGQDLYGEQYSAWQILMNPKTLPPLMQEVRGNMVAHVTPQVAHAVGEAGQNWAFADGMAGFGGFSTLTDKLKQGAMFGGILISMGTQNITPSQNFLESYTMLKDTMKKGAKAPVELYTRLVDAASADARALGGGNSRLVQMIAEGYAKEQKSAVEVLKEIDQKEPYLERAKKAAEVIKLQDEQRKKEATPAIERALVDAKNAELEKELEKELDKELDKADRHTKGSAGLAQMEKKDVPSLKVAKQGLMHSGKVKAPQQLGAEV